MRALLALVLMTGAAQAQPSRLIGDWQVQGLQQTALQDGDHVTLTLAEGRLSAHAGCNRVSMVFPWPEGGAPGPLISTRMACHGRPALLEAALIDALTRADGWWLASGALELLSGGQVVLRAVPRGQ